MPDSNQSLPHDARLSLRVPRQTVHRIDRLAAHSGHRSRSDFVRDAVDFADATMLLASLSRVPMPTKDQINQTKRLQRRRRELERALLPKLIS